jgi:hypothetical protein
LKKTRNFAARQGSIIIKTSVVPQVTKKIGVLFMAIHPLWGRPVACLPHWLLTVYVRRSPLSLTHRQSLGKRAEFMAMYLVFCLRLKRSGLNPHLSQLVIV